MNLKTKLICAIIATMFLAVHSADAATIKIKIKGTLEFGRKSKDCKGLGLCIFLESGTINARIGLDDKKQTLMIEVPYEYVEKDQERFSEEYFLVDEEFVFSDEVQEKLESEGPLIISPGKYKMLNAEEGIQIYFPLKRKF